MQNRNPRASVMSEIRNAMLAQSEPGRIRNNNAADIGYDTDSIAIFEIDKAFTDFLLC